MFDVIVDLRPSSPTYGNWESFVLRGEEQVSLYIPAGCAHGFQALTDPADVSYRIDRPHDPTEDLTIAFDDPDLAIPWPLPVAAMSERDRQRRRCPRCCNSCDAIRSAGIGSGVLVWSRSMSSISPADRSSWIRRRRTYAEETKSSWLKFQSV